MILNPIMQNGPQTHKQPVFVSLWVILILPTFLSASSFALAPTSFHDTGGFEKNIYVPLQYSDGYEAVEKLAQGMFLIAARKLHDPNFQQTVVLLISYGKGGASGVVINRPMKVKLSTVFPDLNELSQRDDVLYLGGPVELNKMLFLVRTIKPQDKALRVFNDVYVSSSREELQRLLKKSGKEERFRIYAGYAGWAPKQLENECHRGDWHVLKADAVTLFDKKSSEIWPELIHHFSVNWVRLNQ